jgi:Tfp pilus assembly protein PilN
MAVGMILGTNIGIELAGKDLRLAVLRHLPGKRRLEQTLEIQGFLELSREEQNGAIARMCRQLKGSTSRVFLSLPREHGVVRQIEFPAEIRDKLKSAIELQLESLSPWSANEVYWDFAADHSQKGAKAIRVTIAIIPRATLDPWIEFFREARLPLSGAALSSLICAHGVTTLWSDGTPTIILDCEAGHVEGSLISGTHLWSFMQTGEETTESVRATVDRLVAVGRISPTTDSRVLVYGPVSSSVGGPVTLPLENAKPDSSNQFGAVAAALSGVRKGRFTSNLIPVAQRYRRSQLQLIPTYVLLMFSALLGLALLGREPYQSMVYSARIEDEIQKIAPVARQVATQQSELNTLSERYRALADHLHSRDYNLEALRELARLLPPTCWLANYSYQDGTITFSGLADSASEIQKVLEDSPLLKDVQFTSSVTRDEKGKDHFTLRATVEVPR